MLADALDRDRLLRAVDGNWADAVIHELTALRKPPLRHRGMTLTNRLRTEGTANLLAAAEVLGARRFLTRSVVFGYGYRDHGPEPLTEDAPFGRPAGDRCDPHVAAMASTERQAFSAPRGSPCATACSTAATPPRCRPCSPGHGRAFGTPPPRRLPRWLFRLAAPYVASFAVDTFMRVSNAKATAEFGWRPAYPTYHDGIRAMVAAARKEEPWPSPGRSGAGTRPA